METYRYTARTWQGEEVSGVLEAGSRDEALRILQDRRLSDIEIAAAEPRTADRPAVPVSLSASDAAEFSQRVAQLTAAQLPLSAGLRAAADETSSRRVAVALEWIADQIDQGRSLEETLTDSRGLLPPHVTGLMLAATRTGNFGESLFELVELQQRGMAVRREISGNYAYPIVVLVLAVVLMIGLGYFTVGMMRQMYDEFGLRLPLATRVLFWWRDTGVQLVVEVVAVLTGLAVLMRVVGGRRRWCALLATVPFFGPVRQWASVAEWSGLMSAFLRHDVLLPEALRWAGRGTRDAQIGQMSLRLADAVARGRKLSQLVSASAELPSSMIPMIEWGESVGGLSDAFRVSQEMLEQRAKTRAGLLNFLFPPLLFVGIGAVVLFAISALFLPLVDLISKLS